jgi:hypothetical protein
MVGVQHEHGETDMRRRAALSEVISSIILSGVVLAVGGALWSYSLGATTVIAENYAEGTLNLVDEITERFTVEWVASSTNGETLTIWVFNYGNVDIEVDVYVRVNADTSKSVLGTTITLGSYEEIPFSFVGDALEGGDIVSIQVYSRRQNVVYYTYFK